MNPVILVVEDDDVIRDLLQDLLEDEGYRVRSAHNGQEGLDLIDEVCPDLIISDVVMPKLDGFGLREAARKEGCRARFILMSAMARTGPWHDAVFLPKPFEVDHLLKIVERELALAKMTSDST
jgi:two-component system response regulator AtoC